MLMIIKIAYKYKLNNLVFFGIKSQKDLSKIWSNQNNLTNSQSLMGFEILESFSGLTVPKDLK